MRYRNFGLWRYDSKTGEVVFLDNPYYISDLLLHLKAVTERMEKLMLEHPPEKTRDQWDEANRYNPTVKEYADKLRESLKE